MNRRFRFLVLASLTLSGPAYAFEWVTHGAITARAWTRMITLDENQTLLSRLGIADAPNAFQSNTYFDIKGTQVRSRSELTFEQKKMVPVPPFSIEGWLAGGAIREDDDPDKKDESPKGDDPDGDMHRVFRHFYDPVRKIPLRIFPWMGPVSDPCAWTLDSPVPCQIAVDWALGTADYTNSGAADSGRRNHFSVEDAREAMFRALTGYDSTFTPIGSDVVTRRIYWATAFRSLGDVLHLNQDMGQPQHTRNDPHSGKGPIIAQDLVTGHKSAFEQFVEDSLTGARKLKVGTDTPPDGVSFTPASLSFEGYPPAPVGTKPDVVRFASYADYWTNSTTGGLADYTNRGFFSARTNLGNPFNAYLSPNPDPSAYTPQTVDATDWDGSLVSPDPNAPVRITLYPGNVTDSVTGGSDTIPLSGRGAWDEFLRPLGKGHFTLYRENYIAQANLVLPRAVGYSAGLLNYFFRGKLRIELPPEKVYAVEDFSTYVQPNAGFKTFKVMVQNDTAAITPPGGAAQPQTTSTTGKLVAVLRYRRNNCLQLVAGATGASLVGSPFRSVDGSGAAVWSEPCRTPTLADQAMPEILVSNRVDLDVAAPDGIDAALKPVVFTFPTALPFNAIDVDLQVIYRGPLGAETDGIAVGFEHINEPTFFNFDNNNDCFADAGDKQCPIGTPDTTCYFSDSVKLPFPEAADEPGWAKVASVTGLQPGQYARVAFLTRSAFREAPPADLEVVTNENFPYDVPVTYIPDGQTMTWLAGPTIRSPLKLSRLLKSGSTSPLNMLEWWGHGTYKLTACANGYCDQFSWASTCAAIDSTPQPVQVNFPQ